MNNDYKVPRRVWNMWSEYGRATFNDIMDVDPYSPIGETALWNGAFLAACEASGLNVEFPAR